MAEDDTEIKKRDKPINSSSKFIFISLVLGIITGLFFGELAAPIKIIGDSYIGLLQMTVLPYLLFSLMANIGRLTRQQASILVRIGLISMVTLWLVSGCMVFILSFSFPSIPSGSFFSAALIQQPTDVDFISLFIPSNIFESLSSNSTPAIVLFCFLFGSALMGLENKGVLLTQLDLVVQTLQKVNGIVIRLTPIGIFAIAASASGTMTLSEFGRLQAYLTAMTVGVLLLSLWIYPMIVSLCTPLSWHRVLYQSRDSLLAAFVLGSVFAVIPLLIETVNKLFSEVGRNDDPHTPELMLPLAYPFPDSGKILTLLFIPFAAWFYGNPLDINDYGLLISSGIFTLFGKVVTAIPFLLDIFKIPNDIFQLFLASGVLMGRIADIAAAMHLITFTIMTTAYTKGVFKPRWSRIAVSFAVTIAISTGVILSLNALFYNAYKDSFSKEGVILSMQTMEKDVPITILKNASPNPVPLSESKTYGDRIIERGILRVGYIPDHLPFSYFNSNGDLVGFDIDLMQELASDLNVGLEFVPYTLSELGQGFTNDHFDIAVSGITATSELSSLVLFSDPYLYVNMAMVIPDSDKDDLSSERNIKSIKPLRVAVKEGSYFINRAKAHFPDIELFPIKSERDYFIADSGQYDALLTSAEGGATWTLLYPGYTTINPVDHTESAPLVFAIPSEMDIEEYLEVWLELKQLDGTSDNLFNYWILGLKETENKPRWSIIRDVLHWVN